MSAKLGTTDAAFRLGAVTPAAVYLGATQVWSAATVPGAPTITAAFYNGPGDVSIVLYDPPGDDGGSAITEYRFYVSGVLETPSSASSGLAEFTGNRIGETVWMSAVNAIGEGPISASTTF